MSVPHVDVAAVLADLKDFQRRTAVWAFSRMFASEDPALRFLVADEVGLGKTHVAKGVIAQVIDHLGRTGDQRHDIVYVCSNAAIARQNLRKLVPDGIEPLGDVGRLTMLPLAQLNTGKGGRPGINLLPITPNTSLKFGNRTGQFEERCLAYTYLRSLWGPRVMSARARWIFWAGVSRESGDERLRSQERQYRPRIRESVADFATLVDELDKYRRRHGNPTIRELFDEIVEGLAWKRSFPDDLEVLRKELIAEVRRLMAIIGVAALCPDLVVLDEFQRFKDLLQPDPGNFAAELAHRLFEHIDPDTGQPTRTLLLSATPYRMYTTADDNEGDNYADFLATCGFLLQDSAHVHRLRLRFDALRSALTSPETLADAGAICDEIGADLRRVMARTERLAATPDRDGMLQELDSLVSVEPDDLRSYLRLGDLAQSVELHEPTEYWKAGPYLVNFMESYKLKEAIERAATDGLLAEDECLEPGPGLLNWADIEAYELIDPQNGRLRWLLNDLEGHRAFELLWIPPSLRYYDTGSVYESPETTGFTKRLIFSGWKVVPKVVSSLVSFEAERRAFAERSHAYTDDYRRRGGQRLAFRTSARMTSDVRPGESDNVRRAAAMTAFLLVWPSPSLAEMGNPRPVDSDRPAIAAFSADVAGRVADAITPILQTAPTQGVVDQRWYWAAPLFLDLERTPSVVSLLLREDSASTWEGNQAGDGFLAHLAEARAMVQFGISALGRPPEDLVEVLTDVAIGGPAVCALRAVSSAVGLQIDHDSVVSNAARMAAAFRSFFNAPEVTAVVVDRRAEQADSEENVARYWRDVLRHSIDGNLQAVLDEHAHVLRDWLGFVSLDDSNLRVSAADDIATAVSDALELRTSSFRVDIPRPNGNGSRIEFDGHRMRTRFAVPFGDQKLESGGEARVGSVSSAFNSPFWPFVLASTSVGQEGLDFHLWCHAVVHWNLPANPVDLEQREGRVHRYKGHAVRKNIASTLGSDLHYSRLDSGEDPWELLFDRAASTRTQADGEMVPYWVFHQGPAKIERLVPMLPFSRDAARLPQLRKALAAYRLAFGQPRQEELVEFLGANRTDADLLLLASQLRIDLSPPDSAYPS